MPSGNFRSVMIRPSLLGRGAILLAGLWLLALLLMPAGAGAHAFLDRSDPEANAVLPTVPEVVRLWFTEPLEAQYSGAELFDANGKRIDTEPHVIGPDPNLMTLPLPPDLPNGTYSVQWRNVSSADGHPEQGYLPFTIGSQSDVVVPTPPAKVDFGGPRAEIAAIGRWLSLLGLAGVGGSVLGWFWVIRPAIGILDEERQKRVLARIRMLALASVGIAVVGSILALFIQSLTVGADTSVSGILGVLTDSRYGHLWIARVVLLLATGVFLYLPYGWREDELPSRWIATGLAVAAMLPFSLNSHGAAPGEGRTAAIAVDWIHLAAASAWVGGLFVLLIGVIYGVRGVQGGIRREFLADVISRFSTVAIAGVVVLSITGFYSSWLQVGNLTALQETSYGQALLFKVLLMLGMVMIGAINLLWLAPQMRTAARTSVQFGRTIAIEVVLGVLVLLMVGLLTSLPTARQTIDARTGRTNFHISQDRLHVSLYITPGAVGNNRYTADFTPADDLPEGTEAFLRVTPVGNLRGIREIPLVETSDGRFESSGAEFSVAGDWDLEIILRRPGAIDWRVSTGTAIHPVPPEEFKPAPAPRLLGFAGAGWALVLCGSVVVMAWGFRNPSSRTVGWFGVGLLVISMGGIWLNHERPVAGIDVRNPIASTAASIEIGRELFAENCVICHGPLGQGDGEQLVNVNSWRADLTAPHLYDHTEGELHWWISYGKGGTLMPGFSEVLTDEERWHLVNYVYYLNENSPD